MQPQETNTRPNDHIDTVCEYIKDAYSPDRYDIDKLGETLQYEIEASLAQRARISKRKHPLPLQTLW